MTNKTERTQKIIKKVRLFTAVSTGVLAIIAAIKEHKNN